MKPRQHCKRNLTLSVSNTTPTFQSGTTVKFTAPSNSRSIRATSSAVRRKSLPVSSIMVSMGRSTTDEPANSSRIADKRGDVAGLRVERALGIQGRPPLFQPSLKPKFTSWRFGNLEKSKDCSKVSQPSTSGIRGVSVDIVAGIGEGV